MIGELILMVSELLWELGQYALSGQIHDIIVTFFGLSGVVSELAPYRNLAAMTSFFSGVVLLAVLEKSVVGRIPVLWALLEGLVTFTLLMSQGPTAWLVVRVFMALRNNSFRKALVLTLLLLIVTEWKRRMTQLAVTFGVEVAEKEKSFYFW